MMWWCALALAVEVQSIQYEGAVYTVVEVRPDDQLALVGQRDSTQRTLTSALQANPLASVAMNAGMYHRGRVPVGLHVEDGLMLRPLDRTTTDGNFGLLPNGVFGWSPGRARVTTTDAWSGTDQVVTQSGPMLVIDGALHPAFRAESPNKRMRNGVGVSSDGTVWWAISEQPVRFHQLASLFRDRLNCPNALYLDGTVSGLATRTGYIGGRSTAFEYGGVLLVSPKPPPTATQP